jgi:50S ribosomal protein L16 3-hydroxylase
MSIDQEARAAEGIGGGAAQTALERLLAPMAPSAFLAEHWERAPAFVRGGPAKFDGLFDRDRFARAIVAGAGASPYFRLSAIVGSARENPLTLASTVPVEPEEVEELVESGVTICVNSIDAGDPDLAAFAAEVKEELCFLGSVWFNCYLSGPGSGADLHIDQRVTTTLQLAGRKRWRYGAAPAFEWPPSNAQLQDDGTPMWMSPWAGDEEWSALEPPDPSELREVVLEPGDLLYMPAGTWHDAKGIEESLALNLSFGPITFVTYLAQLLEPLMLHNPRWRGSPPPALATELEEGVLPASVAEYVGKRLKELEEALGKLEPDSPEVLRAWELLRMF